MTETNYNLIVRVTDYVEPNLDWEESRFADAGVDYRHFQMRDSGPAELLEKVADAEVLIVDQARINAEVIRGLGRCKLIIRHGDGFDNLDLSEAEKAGIICINQPGFFSRNVAEQAFTVALALALRIPVQREIAPKAVPGAGWNLAPAMPYSSFRSLSVGVVGYGRIGRSTVDLFEPIVQKVFVHDPYIGADKGPSPKVSFVELEELLANSDIICLHVPGNPETANMLSAERLAECRSGAILINYARGSVVDTEALVQALQSGRLAGAALDSTVPEPLPADHPLFRMKNVIVTPHMGWYSEDAMWAIRRSIVEDSLGVIKGMVPDSVVNPGVFDSPTLRWT